MRNIKSAWLSRWSKGGFRKDVKLELPTQCPRDIPTSGTTVPNVKDSFVLFIEVI